MKLFHAMFPSRRCVPPATEQLGEARDAHEKATTEAESAFDCLSRALERAATVLWAETSRRNGEDGDT